MIDKGIITKSDFTAIRNYVISTTGNLSILQYLVSNDLCTVNDLTIDSFHLGSCTRVDVLEYVMEKGAKIDAEISAFGRTPLEVH